MLTQKIERCPARFCKQAQIMGITVLTNQVIIKDIRKTQARNHCRLKTEFKRIPSIIVKRIEQERKIFTLLALQYAKIKSRKTQVFKIAFFPIVAQTRLKTASNKVRVGAQKITVGIIVTQTDNAAGRLSIEVGRNSAGKQNTRKNQGCIDTHFEGAY